MFKHYLHVLVLLIASKRVLEHGLGQSCVGCHVALVKIAQTSLKHVVNYVVGALFVNRHSSDEPKLASFYLPLWLLSGHDDCSAS